VFDKAYVGYTFDNETKPVSITQVPELLDLGHEVVSLSKHNNFVGLGLGYVVSSKENIDRWLKLSSNFSQGVNWIKQKGGVVALTDPEAKKEMSDYMHDLKERRDVLVTGLNRLGLKCTAPKATPYLFPKIPEAFKGDDEKFTFEVLDKAHVAMMPGSYFGESESGANCGKGHVRPTLFQPKEVMIDALKRMEETRSW
jgi:LL-diaminopimelate aminotransferase